MHNDFSGECSAPTQRNTTLKNGVALNTLLCYARALRCLPFSYGGGYIHAAAHWVKPLTDPPDKTKCTSKPAPQCFEETQSRAPCDTNL